MPREIERLLVLSLSAEDAVRSERWDEAADLMRARDAALATVESQGVAPRDAGVLQKVREADARLAQALADVRSSLVDEIAQTFRARRAHGAYAPSAAAHGTRWDRTG